METTHHPLTVSRVATMIFITDMTWHYWTSHDHWPNQYITLIHITGNTQQGKAIQEQLSFQRKKSCSGGIQTHNIHTAQRALRWSVFIHLILHAPKNKPLLLNVLSLRLFGEGWIGPDFGMRISVHLLNLKEQRFHITQSLQCHACVYILKDTRTYGTPLVSKIFFGANV